MFTKNELSLLTDSYFKLIRQADTFIELMSLNTKHCWIIHKHSHEDKYPIWLHHKHHRNDPYYHKHFQTFTVSYAIQQIKNHDSYVLKKQPTTLADCSTP